MRESWRRGLARQVTRLRDHGRGAVLWSLRVTVAAVASYVVAILLFSGPPPLLAPLTAMLVVQVTPVSLLASGLDRVVSVVAGVAVAVVFAELVPLSWWSLGMLIFVSITLGQALRLRANLMEVAISAMLVLGVGSFATGSAAWQRIAETLIGAAVGVAVNLLFPPKVASADAGRAIDQVADRVSALLVQAADELETLVEEGAEVSSAARSWLGDARRINHDIPRAGAALLHAEQGRRLNVRAVGTPNAGPGLRQGLEALEHSAVAIRGMFRTVVDGAEDVAWSTGESRDLLLGLAQTWREMSAAVDAFGQLVADEAGPGGNRAQIDGDVVRDALQGLHESRGRLEDALTTEAAGPRLEVLAAVLGAVKRLLRELDLDQRLRRQVRLARTSPRRVPRPPVRRWKGPSSPADAMFGDPRASEGAEPPEPPQPPEPPEVSETPGAPEGLEASEASVPSEASEAETQVLDRIPDEP